ncbi:hypothetical protein SDC9_67274 [bioreactor metagenome]|uniref:Uncharacterized protein n=1 Tax=bioreactor metagenome TaxID=1076179 RepID=A0A644XX53_9ZZZZ
MIGDGFLKMGQAALLGIRKIAQQQDKHILFRLLRQLRNQVLEVRFRNQLCLNGNQDAKVFFQLFRQAFSRFFVQDDFFERQRLELVEYGILVGQQGDFQFPRSDIGISQRIAARFVPDDTGQVIVCLALASVLIQKRTGCNDPHDFPAHHAFCQLGVFHLFANGNLVPHFHESPYVFRCSMKRDPAHRNRFIGIFVAARERNFQ